jgi:transcriptional regulator with XRE-family HTH domain
MARAALGWGVRELATRAGVTANTVTRIENGADAKQSTMTALQEALEAAGVEFTNGERPGVGLSPTAPTVAELAGSSNLTKDERARPRRSKKTNEKKR